MCFSPFMGRQIVEYIKIDELDARNEKYKEKNTRLNCTIITVTKTLFVCLSLGLGPQILKCTFEFDSSTTFGYLAYE